MDGQHSCYHGPSFQIYLQSEDTLKHSPEFTRLAQEYCGLFQTDDETKTIRTMTKSGCCWHQFSEFIVINNVPKPLQVIEEDATNLPFLSITTIDWKGNKKIEKTEKVIDPQHEDFTELCSFELTKNRKKVVVFSLEKQLLQYALLRPDKTIEFLYPVASVSANQDFRINKAADSMRFKNQNAVYEIYGIVKENCVTQIGVVVEINGKRYDLKGDINTVQGSLKDIPKASLENVSSYE